MLIINRHDEIDAFFKYWNNTEHSNIGLGRFKRNEDFTITKTYGRTDIGLFNHTDGSQYCFGPNGFYSNTPQEVKEIMLKEICSNMEQVLRSLHYMNWLDKQEIVNMPFDECVSLLQKGLDSFNYEEALKLFLVE